MSAEVADELNDCFMHAFHALAVQEALQPYLAILIENSQKHAKRVFSRALDNLLPCHMSKDKAEWKN